MESSRFAARTGVELAVWRIAAVTSLGAIMSILDMTIVNVALEHLTHDLHASVAQIQWIITGYSLALGAVIPISGWASRRVGARTLYIVSLLLFTLGSLLCGFAWSSGSLVLFRVLQGVGGGMMQPVGQMMVVRAAGPERMGRVMAVTGIPVMLGPMLGPVLGGLLIDYAGWRWIFFINVPIGALTLLLALRQLPRHRSEPAGPIDVRGFVLLTLGVPALTYGLAEMGQKGVGSPNALVPVVAGLVLLAAFVLHALRATRPLLEIRLYVNRAFAAASLTTFALTGALMGGIILMPLYYQTLRGISAVETGLLLIPQAVGMLVTTPLGGRLSDRIGGGILSMVGVSIAAAASVPLILIGARTSFVVISAILFVRGLGIGMTFMPAMAAAFRCLRPEQLADATPQMNVIQRVGGSIGTAIVAVVLGRQLAHASGAGGAAHAFGHTWLWVVVATTFAVVPAGFLARVERRERRAATHARVAVPEPGAAG